MLDLIRKELIDGYSLPAHPFRYFYFATFSEFPEIRTLVNRKADHDCNIWFYTDSRSPKTDQIKANSHVSALFYHPEIRLQLRLKGIAIILNEKDPVVTEALQSLSEEQSRDYRTFLAPGKQVSADENLLFTSNIFFSVVHIIPKSLDILQLFRSGHQRGKFHRENGEWIKTKVIP